MPLYRRRLADKGESEAYCNLRGAVEPVALFASELNAQLV